MSGKNILHSGYRIPLFCLTTFLFWASLYTYSPILSPYLHGLGASNEMIGIIVGSYGFTQMIFRIPLGIASDKFHKRKLFITFGMMFSILSAAGLFIFKELSVILIFRSLAGAAAATWVDFTILFTSYYKHEESTKAIGTLNFYNTIGQTAAMFAGGIIADFQGWTAPFMMGIVISAAGLILSFFIIDKFEGKGEELTLKGFVNVATDKILLSVSFLAIVAQSISFATVYGFTPVFANSELHTSKLALGLLTVFSSLPGAVASLLIGTGMAKKFGEKKLIMFGFALTGAFTIIIPFTHSYGWLILTQIFAGFGRGFSFPLLMSLSIKHIKQDKRATAMGFFQSIYGLGMFLGPVIMGIIADFASLRQGFIIIGALCLLTIPLVMLLLRPATGSESKTARQS